MDSGEPTEDTGGPAPWTDLTAEHLVPFYMVADTTIDHANTPTRLVARSSLGGAFVLDGAAQQVHVLDSRYHHDGRSYCVNQERPKDSTVLAGAADCPDGSDLISRGSLVFDERPIAVAADASRLTVGVLTQSAMLFQAPADPARDDALELLVPNAGLTVHGLTTPLEGAVLAIDNGKAAIASGTQLVVLNLDTGTELVHILPGQARDVILRADDVWIATDGGVWHNSAVLDAIGDKLVWWQDSVWLVQTALGQITDLLGTETISHEGLLGPVVIDPLSGKLVLSTAEGRVRIAPDGSMEALDDRLVIDLGINQAGELISLLPEGQVQVHVDETAYGALSPLQVFVTTFSERPRSSTKDTYTCRGEARDTIEHMLSLSLVNHSFLSDLPAPIALGLTPQLIRRAAMCDMSDQIEQLLFPSQFHTGILMHEQPEDCAFDASCHASFLHDELQVFTDADITPVWVSGLAPHHEVGVNWVESLSTIGAPNRFLFFGMSLRPSIPHEGDLRAKDAWPITLGGLGKAWSTDASATIDDRAGRGWLNIYPADNVPAFNLGACANLFINECHPLGKGGGVTIKDEDVQSLDLLLHRSLAGIGAAESHTWSFHLPDIGTYDYTINCTRTDRVWTGEDCQAALLQTWLIDIHQRLVQAGLVAWTGPTALEIP